MNETELAWAAGFFDGEGWVSVNTEQQALEVGVGQKRRETLDRFRAAVGVGRIYCERNNEFASWRATSAEDQYTTFRLLWPHLSGPKKEQARDRVRLLRDIRTAHSKRRVKAVEGIYELMEEVMLS